MTSIFHINCIVFIISITITIIYTVAQGGNGVDNNKRKQPESPFDSNIQELKRNDVGQDIKIIDGCPEIVKIRLKRQFSLKLPFKLEWDKLHQSLIIPDLKLMLIYKMKGNPGVIGPIEMKMFYIYRGIENEPEEACLWWQSSHYSKTLSDMIFWSIIVQTNQQNIQYKELIQMEAQFTREWNIKQNQLAKYYVYLLIDPSHLKSIVNNSNIASSFYSSSSGQHSLINANEETMEYLEFLSFLNSIFYIGKGTEFRKFDHMLEIIEGSRPIQNKEKYDRIIGIGIWNTKKGVIIVEPFSNIPSDEALRREAAMIQTLGTKSKHLTNILEGVQWNGNAA